VDALLLLLLLPLLLSLYKAAARWANISALELDLK
jgi:hypothetical protein